MTILRFCSESTNCTTILDDLYFQRLPYLANPHVMLQKIYYGTSVSNVQKLKVKTQTNVLPNPFFHYLAVARVHRASWEAKPVVSHVPDLRCCCFSRLCVCRAQRRMRSRLATNVCMHVRRQRRRGKEKNASPTKGVSNQMKKMQ